MPSNLRVAAGLPAGRQLLLDQGPRTPPAEAGEGIERALAGAA